MGTQMPGAVRARNTRAAAREQFALSLDPETAQANETLGNEIAAMVATRRPSGQRYRSLGR